MSHAVVRSDVAPSAAQLYLDGVLEGVLRQFAGQRQHQHQHSAGRSRESVNISEILLYALQQNPSALYMINSFTGKSFTFGQICRRAISLARALISGGAKGKVVLVLMRNSEHMAALFYGLLFTAAVPLMVEPAATAYEILHFMELAEPFAIFCDEEVYGEVIIALKKSQNCTANVVIANDDFLIDKLIGDHSDDIPSFKLSPEPPESTFILLPTSGSTGLPKASCLNHQGMIAQLPTLWTYHDKFPTPTKLAMLLSTPQWITHTMVMLASPVFQIPILVSPLKCEPQNVLHITETFRPTWTLMSPSLTSALVSAAFREQISSLETLIVTGSPVTLELRTALTKKIPDLKRIIDGYGMTEAQGFITLQGPSSPPHSSGKICNIFQYKIVDESGREVNCLQTGELYLKSSLCIFKGYYNNIEEHRQCVTASGWLRTGDLFYGDSEGNVFYVARKKFMIKYMNYHISPEELERVIAGVPGVQESAVCGTARGAAAAVVPRPGCAPTRQQIHSALAQLSDYKQLRGGIAFVDSLPRTASGKVARGECARLLAALVDQQVCF